MVSLWLYSLWLVDGQVMGGLWLVDGKLVVSLWLVCGWLMMTIDHGRPM